MSPASLPSWLPAGARDIQEEAAQDALHNIHRCEMHVPLLQRSLQTAYLETAAAAATTGSWSVSASCVCLRGIMCMPPNCNVSASYVHCFCLWLLKAGPTVVLCRIGNHPFSSTEAGHDETMCSLALTETLQLHRLACTHLCKLITICTRLACVACLSTAQYMPNYSA